MTSVTQGYPRLVLNTARPFLAPLAGLLFFVFWMVAEAGRMLVDDVGYRLVVVTWIVSLALLALAIGAAELLPRVSLALAGGFLLVQLGFWPARFTANSWPVYFGYLIVILGLALHTSGRLRRVALGCSAAFAAVISVLLTVPAFGRGVSVGVWPILFAGIASRGPGSVLRNVFAVFAVALGCVAVAWLAGSLLRRLSKSPTFEKEPHDDTALQALSDLSDRERDVFLLAARGLSNSQIARDAYISETTVKSHMSRILAKLGISSRAQLVAFAWEKDLVSR